MGNVKGIISDKMYDATSYLSLVTGKFYPRNKGLNDYDKIYEALEEAGLEDELWDFPLSEEDYILKEGYKVVLVELKIQDETTGCLKKEYRFFQVPDSITKEKLI